MKYYELHTDPDTYDALVLAGKQRYAALHVLRGDRFADSWKAPRVSVVKGEKRGDFPALASHVPVLNERAWEALRPLIGGSVEALPLQGSGGPYYAINVLDVLDCLDPAASVINRVPTGELVSIKKYAFKPSVLEGHDIFRVRGAELKYIIVSERFKSAVREHGLHGFIFKRVG